MASAKKYFSPEEQKQNEGTTGKKANEGTIEKMIEKINKKASDNYFSNKGGEYIVPLPEKITPDSQAGSLDDVIEGKQNPGKKGTGTSIVPRGKTGANPSSSNPVKTIPNSGLYVVGEIFEKFRNSIVGNPMSPTYQVARKIGDKIIKESSDSYGILFKEATNIGIYVLIEVILGKKYLK
jgi:hypothetical protein